MHRPRSSHAPFPPPPDIEPIDDPYAPVVFEPRGNGLLVAKLGCIVVGMIAPTSGRFARAWWSCFLPDTSRAAQPVSSIEAGKDRLAHRVRDWVDAAGLRA